MGHSTIRRDTDCASNIGRVESSFQSDETRRQRIEQRNTCRTIAELSPNSDKWRHLLPHCGDFPQISSTGVFLCDIGSAKLVGVGEDAPSFHRRGHGHYARPPALHLDAAGRRPRLFHKMEAGEGGVIACLSKITSRADSIVVAQEEREGRLAAEVLGTLHS